MRRQVRPFVTEVRASGRRAKDAAFAATRPDGARETDQPRGTFGGNHEAAEDSYEAAMKAADALFSGARAAPATPQPATPKAATSTSATSTSATSTAEVSDLAVPASSTSKHAIVARNGAYARSTADADAVFAPPTEHAPTSQNGRDLPESGGRILRAIEAPNADPFAALEAERAPKRRGRKPGSKNKPKLPIAARAAEIDVAPRTVAPSTVAAKTIATATPFDSSRMPKTQRSDAGARTAALVASLSDEAPSAFMATPIRRTPAPPANGTTRDRFAWIRTKLRPGEKWKRRLPKIAW